MNIGIVIVLSHSYYLLLLMIVVDIVANKAINRYIHRVVFTALIMFCIFLVTAIAIDVLIAWPKNLILPRKAYAVPYSFLGDAFNAEVVFGAENSAYPSPRINSAYRIFVTIVDIANGIR